MAHAQGQGDEKNGVQKDLRLRVRRRQPQAQKHWSAEAAAEARTGFLYTNCTGHVALNLA